MAEKGRFLVLDGPDGAGKTTQATLLVKRLHESGFDTLHLRDPGHTALGEEIRILLLDPLKEIKVRAEALLFLAARAQLVDEQIRPALTAGKIVVCERFNPATIAYQGFAGGIKIEQLETMCNFATGGLNPDLTVVLDIDPEEGLRRIERGKDRMELRGIDYHEKVRQGFLQYVMGHPGAAWLVEASAPKEEIHERIWGNAAGVL